jgi:hypothetical protein
MEASDSVVVLALLVLIDVCASDSPLGLGLWMLLLLLLLLLAVGHSKIATPGSIYVASSGLFSPVHRSVPSRRHKQRQLQYSSYYYYC